MKGQNYCKKHIRQAQAAVLGGEDDDDNDRLGARYDRRAAGAAGILVERECFLGVLISILLTIICRSSERRTRRNKVPQYHRAALMRPLRGVTSTPWKRTLTFGNESDSIVSINITKQPLL